MLGWYWEDMKDWFRENLTRLCLWTIKKINRIKDRSLAYRLHDLSIDYETRPYLTCKNESHMYEKE